MKEGKGKSQARKTARFQRDNLQDVEMSPELVDQTRSSTQTTGLINSYGAKSAQKKEYQKPKRDH
ncbi:MAG: hypothetical protein ACOYD6_04825 [Limnochordia bacterium]|jgi:hypothetical protein